MKRRATGAAAALCLVAGAVGGISAANWQGLVPGASRALEESTGLRLASEPRVRLRVLPMPHLVVEDVVLEMENGRMAALQAASDAFAEARAASGRSAEGARPFLRAERIFVTANPAALAMGGPFVNVHIENPDVQVRRFGSAGYDADPVLRMLSQMGDRRSGPAVLLPALRSVTILDGRLFYEDVDGTGEHALLVGDGRIRIDLGGGRIRAKADAARYGDRSYRYDVVLEPFESENWRARGRVVRVDGVADIRATSFEGSILLHPGPEAHLTVRRRGG